MVEMNYNGRLRKKIKKKMEQLNYKYLRRPRTLHPDNQFLNMPEANESVAPTNQRNNSFIIF